MRKIFSLFAAILFAGSMMAAVGDVFYTFVPQKLSSGNVSDYTKTGDQTVDDMVWNVPGNWYATGALRLGGKSIENVDRSIIGKSAIGDAIAKIVISHAGINSTDLVLNTVKLTVASDAEFSADVETKTLTLNTDYTVEKDKAGTIEFTPAGDFWAKNSYYKFDFNFTNTNGSNRALTLNKIEFYSYSDVEITHWTVAGSSATLFGTTWDPANKDNEMIQQEDGSFKWEKTELELAEGTIAFKVCKNYTWDEAYPAKDYELAIPEGAIYTVTINFNPESKEIAAVATKTGEAVVLPTVVLHGNFFGGWKDTDPFAPAEDKLTARLNLTLAEGNYEFGFKFDGAWKANGANITREAPTTSLAEGSGNMHFAADAAGEYQLTYTFESQTLEVAFPKKPEVLPEGAFKLTFNGTGEANKDASAAYGAEVEAIFDAASAPYVASVQEATKVYAGRPIADDNSSLKFGTSSAAGTLAFTLATPVEVDSIIVNATQYGDKASEVTVNDVKFDLTAGNKIPQNCKITPEGTISTITIAQTGSERLYVRSVTVYAKGTPTPPEPVKTLPVVALAGGMNGWSADANILVAAEDSLSASVKVALEAGDVEFKIVSDGKWLSLNGEDPDGLYSFHRDWTTASHVNVIDGRNFKLTADVAGDYIFTWTYADSTLAITFPAKPEPVEDNFWKATSETAVTPEAVYVDDDMLTLSTVFAGTLKENARTIATVDFTHAIQVRVDAWPTEEVKTGTEKSGSTPLVLTAKEDIAITLYYNRQTVDGSGTENDNKDVWVFDHTAITTPMTGEFIIDQILDEDKYLNATKKLQLIKGHTYTIAAKGTTLQLHGIKYEASVAPADPTAAVTGDMTEWGEPIPFELSMDKTFASYTNDNIKAGTYAFKMIINGEWRSNGYEFHRGFPGCAGISGNTDANMTVVIDVEGAYTFEWYFENDSLAIKFPAKPEPVLTDGYYLVGSFSDWKAAAENLFVANPDAEGEYQLDINLTAGDEIKVAYVEADATTTWFPKEGNYIVDANHSGATTMYFRPDYKEEWAAFGGYFFIVPTGTEGIEEILSEGKAVKVIREGNLIILKGDKAYNAMGQIVK